jgi:hypothetical protein
VLRTLTPIPLAFWLLLSLVACGEWDREVSPGRIATGFAVEDSAGIAILVTTGDVAFAPIDWSVRHTPDLVIGDRPNPDEQLFQIRGVAPLPDGGVAVLDGSSRELRFYDVNGDLRVRTGREGSGPGEFRRPRLVPSLSMDSVLLHDHALRRLTVYSTDGIRRGQTTWSQPGAAPLGVLDGRALLERRPPIRLDESPRSGATTDEPTFSWVDLTSGAEIRLRSYVLARYFTYPPGAGEALPSGRTIPFTARPSAVVSPGGAVVTSANDFDILEFDVTGTQKRILRVNAPRRPVTRNDIAGVIDLELSEFTSAMPRSEYARRFREMPIPDLMPVFVSLIVDDLGWLWAQHYEWDTRLPTRWVVFDPTGRGRGTVTLLADLKIHHIAADYILGVWTSEYGVEHVRRHTLNRN